MMAYSGRVPDYLGEGLASARPASLNLAPGSIGFWRSTDTGAISVWSGGAWSSIQSAAPNIVTTISSGTITPAGGTDLVRPAALTAALTIANPSSTPADGAGFVVDLIDNGTTRALTWGSKYADRMAALPTTTTVSKRHRIGFEYNAAYDKLYCMYAQVQA